MKQVKKTPKKYAVSIFEYRCRRCHAVFSNSIEHGFEGLVIDMMNLNHLTNLEAEKDGNEELGIKELSDKATLYEIHVCDDGGRGLSDLIGCEPPREVVVVKREWDGHYRQKFQERKFYNFGLGQWPTDDQ